MLTKRDNSLWLWGVHHYDWRSSSNSIPHKLKIDLTTPPERIGDETDWTALFPAASGDSPRAVKNDGSVWHWEGWVQTNFSFAMAREADLKGPWVKLVHLNDNSFVGIKTNGSLWVVRDIDPAGWKQKERQVEIELEKDTQWKSVGGNWTGVYAIRDDGTLWRWYPTWNLSDLSVPVQLGDRSDWVALDVSWPGNFAVAADGSLWAWNQPSRHIWLAPSQKPVYFGNILDGSPAEK